MAFQEKYEVQPIPATSTRYDTDQTKVALLDIQVALLDSPHFKTIHSLSANQATWIVRDMAAKWSVNRHLWANPGAFIHNYAERAMRLMEAFVAYRDTRNEVERSQYETALWEQWAEVCEAFLAGS